MTSSTIPPRRTRAALAFWALCVGWICGSLVTWGMELMLSAPVRFDVSPGDLLEGGTSFQDGYLMVVAAIIGAVTWWTYTWTLRKS